MRLPVIAHPVLGHGPLQRVLVPTARLRHTWLLAPTQTGYGKVTSSRADLLRLGALTRLAAISPHSAVHVPLRQNEIADDVSYWFHHNEPVDLLIVRTDVGLRPSAWPGVRSSFRRRSSAAKPVTVRTPEPRTPVDLRSRDWTSDRQVTLTEYASTLMLSGTAWSLHQVGDLVTEAGDTLATDRDIHRSGVSVLSTLTPVLRRGGKASRRQEFDIYGRDEIFHKSRWAKRD